MSDTPASLASIVIRCGTPDCDWGISPADLGASELNRGQRDFWQHCIDRHRVDPDSEIDYWFDLQEFTWTVLK